MKENLNPIRPIVELAKFVGSRLLGGGWSELPDTSTTEPVLPQRASITYIPGVQGEEV